MKSGRVKVTPMLRIGSRELCIMACSFCRLPDFLTYLQSIDPAAEVWTEGAAKQFILAACEVSSRSDLDRDAEAARRFHERVRAPFIAWREERDQVKMKFERKFS